MHDKVFREGDVLADINVWALRAGIPKNLMYLKVLASDPGLFNIDRVGVQELGCMCL